MEQPCGFCDLCENRVLAEAPGSPEPFGCKSWVRHKEWGRGLVMRYEGDKVIVLFDEVGEKKLAVDFVAAHGLLEPLG